jgi:hypothetical protein
MCNSCDFPHAGITTEERKISSIAHFISNHPTAKSVGFSDDDPENLNAVRDFFRLIAFPPKRKIYDASTLAIGGT